MIWPLMIVLTLGVVGFCLMLVAFVLIACQGGWQKAIQQPIAEKRWPWPRRLLVAGAGLGMLFGIGLVVLRMIPGGIPWLHPSEQLATNFDPQLTLVWPDTPEESRRRIDAGTADETSIYGASLTQADPTTVFSASVYLISEKDLKESDPQELLAGHMTSDTDEELTRQKIEHGPNKYPGYDMTAKSGTSFLRRVTVMFGRRLYSVEVISLKQERLNAEDVAKFFESFAIKE